MLTYIIVQNEEKQKNEYFVWTYLLTLYLLRRKWRRIHQNLFMELALEDLGFRRYFFRF